MASILTVLGSNIRQKRIAVGLSQEELAKRAGLHRTYLGGVERGERNVSVQNLARIASALGVEAFELLHPARTPEE
jgi:transcriptional regulator with XRE-family HTH domain